MQRVAVLGPGGVGGLVAAALARAGTDVVVVGREETAAAIAAEGLTVHSLALGDFSARPRAVPRLSEPVDVLLATTKAGALEAALERVAAPPGLVVPLLNGLDHLAVLRARFGHVAAGTIRVESTKAGATTILQTSAFLRVELAGKETEPLAAALRAAGVPAEARGSEAEILWSKLVRLNVLALLTTAYGTMGRAREHPGDLEGVARETAAVARAEGVAVDDAQVREELAAVHPDFLASMARDQAARRPLELDAIAGAVQRAGARHGISTPTIDRLRAKIEAA